MKKYKFEEIAEIEKELIDDFFGDFKKDRLDKLIKEYELNIKNEERLKAIKYRYLPKLSILTRIKETLNDE